MATAAVRKTAEERREQIVDAATTEFAAGGLYGTSTDAIARRVGISQPYLFRLFRTKKELFLEVVRQGFARTLEAFQLAVGKAEGEELFAAMGAAYVDLLASDRRLLLTQLQAYGACDDRDVRTCVREGFAELYRYVERVSKAERPELQQFFAVGMLINVMAAMDLEQVPEPWAEALVGECLKP